MAEAQSWVRRARNSAYVAARASFERGLPHWPIERLERMQGRAIRSIVAHAYESVPFYRRAMDERGLRPGNIQCAADLRALPLIDGLAVQQSIDDFTSTRYDDRTRETFYSSGSASGVRRRIYWDAGYVVRALPSAERDRLILTKLAGEKRLKTILRELVGEARAKGPLRKLVGDSRDHQRLSIFPGDSASRTMRIVWSELTLMPPRPAHHHFLRPQMPLETVAERMNEIRPRIVFSFGSYADQFFRFIADRELSVAVPRVWMYTGDSVSTEGRALADERYGCKLYATYSAMEAQRIAIQCERREGFHINLDLFDVRAVDEEGRDVEPGTPGDVVVSNLHNRAMVLLNYRLGDRAALLVDRCPCGRTLPLLSRLEGRRSEVLRLADGREISSLSLDNYFTRELKPTLKAQLAQSRPGELRWRVVPFSGVDRDALERALLDRAREVLGDDTKLVVEFVDDIAPTAQGKFLRMVSEPAQAQDDRPVAAR